MQVLQVVALVHTSHKSGHNTDIPEAAKRTPEAGTAKHITG